jgi:hypothetical protein
MHRHDQNFPQEALDRLQDFIEKHDAITSDPISHAKLIREVKVECILATEYSPYLEVRANTEATDDPTMPCLTFRAMVIGTLFAGAGSFIDTLFAFRQPPVYVGTTVGQLVACESFYCQLHTESRLTICRSPGQVYGKSVANKAIHSVWQTLYSQPRSFQPQRTHVDHFVSERSISVISHLTLLSGCAMSA